MRPIPIFSPSPASACGPTPTPAEPGAFVAPRPRGSRRPHTDAKVATVRRLIEQTTLTYGEIAARTGVGRASICRWTRDGGWQRPPFAPRATDTVPRARASAKLRRHRWPRASPRSPNALSLTWRRARTSISTSSPRRWSS